MHLRQEMVLYYWGQGVQNELRLGDEEEACTCTRCSAQGGVYCRPHVVGTQLDLPIKIESFDDMKFADYFFLNIQDFT